ncbi:MAG TPA: VWA domain-containing protein [Candidatus Angelobacter sp.]|nr:VWA domain-containing protein [Candidatus Angelobacter sp.]
MSFQFTNPAWLLLLLVAVPWTIWLALRSDVQIGAWRRWTAFSLRMVIVVALILAIAGLQWKRPQEGMNVFFVLDRSDSIPPEQQEAARLYVSRASAQKKPVDKAGVLVFGTDAAIDTSPNSKIGDQKIQAVVGSERTDVASAIRLGTAAFPETGQKRLVLLSDGNENVGDALAAVLAAKPLGVSVDVVPLGVARGGDVSVQKLSLPGNIKKGQTFEVKIFAQADQAQRATVRLFQNDHLLGEQKVQLEAGKNLFTFPQTLTEPGFYSYEVEIEAPGDSVPQNNRAINFTTVRGDPRVLVVSAEPDKDALLAEALRSANLDVKIADTTKFPGTLAEMQSYDTIFLSNVAAGDLGDTLMKLLESAVRDFGVGLVCVGGDQTYAAGSYRGTPLEETLPVDMELSSKKVLPPGAVALIMHGMEFMNGNQIARDCAVGVLEALGPQDEMGVLLWDGTEHWLFPLAKVGDKKAMRRSIAGMNQGDLGSFQNIMGMAHEALKKSNASLKHIIVFSDGDPAAPTPQLMQSIVSDRITVSTVLIAGHAGPETMDMMAQQGHGRFYPVQSADQLPQIFIKEAAVILKSAIYEEPFKPQQVSSSELIRGIAANEYPQLRGYVATSQKQRAETPLLTDKGDPLLAHWQFGLGRAVAFTSDAKAKWAQDWLGWPKYQQFWSQIAKWSLRRLDNADFTTDVTIDKGEGVISVEALDEKGNYRNFLNLQSVVVSPKGERQTVRLEQTGPGHYEARFPTKAVGAYALNLMDIANGAVRGTQRLGASVNYSPEFGATEPNNNLLRRLAEAGGGKMLDPGIPAENPFLHDRLRTFQPRDLWEWLLKLAIILFPLDVGVRRVQLDKAEWLNATATLRRWLFFWRGTPRTPEADESLAALLARRDQVRSKQTAPMVQPSPELFKPERPAVITHAKDEIRPAEPVTGSPAEGPDEAKSTGQAASTASRLLEAKRRAQQRKDL